MSKIIGIDVSKQTFDVAFKKNTIWHHKVFKNESGGFNQLLKLVEFGDWLVMEASGPYYFRLATKLYEAKHKVCVLNPLIIRRYSQTRLYRAKTDKKDAQTIAEYGAQYQLKAWYPSRKENNWIKQLHTAIELINKQIHQSKRQLESFEITGVLNKELRKELKGIIKLLERRKVKLERQLNQLAIQTYSDSIRNITSIPGVGLKTAIMMCVLTDDFKKFDNHKQLTAYIGFSPKLFQSGSSIKGKGHICKMGSPQTRKLLYLCSWSAKKVNKRCIEMYDRLKAKGKPERVIKIAIANKLIKQIFAIGKNKSTYSENYCEIPCF